MLFKMLGIQRVWELYPDMGPRPRQVFVTQSRFLATRVEEYFAKLMSSLETGSCSPEELRMIEKDAEQEDGMVGEDDNKQWRSDLPESFNELLDEHFPLFITYDRVRISLLSKDLISPFRGQLCTMLEKCFWRGNHNDAPFIPRAHAPGDEATSPTSPTPPWKSKLSSGSGIASSSDYMQQYRRKFVSYGEFLASYWDHLPQTFTRALGRKQQLIYGLL